MALNYKLSIETIKQRLEVAHNPNQAVIRGQFFDLEYAFFQQNIRNQNVLVAGSGLGHDSFELARYNKKVVGVELIKPFVDHSNKQARILGLNNVVFQYGDITHLSFRNEEFDSAVLNMGTIGNFDDKQIILRELLRVANKVYFDFYPPTNLGLEKRRKMYSEEKWKNVRIEGDKVVSDDGLDSISLSQKELDTIIQSLGAKVKYYKFHEFSIMAEVTK
ncbi:class I SAM-dependent methyltransferase [Candidatus Woesearchaeota archaeon]|nr:class I SAM-dependent methyltransferase [Candidatus Woesearchaeota archaeon]